MSETNGRPLLQRLDELADARAFEHLTGQLAHETSREVLIVNGRAHNAAAWLAVAGVPAIAAGAAVSAMSQPYQKHYAAEVERQMQLEKEAHLRKVFTNEQREWNDKVEARKQAKKARKLK